VEIAYSEDANIRKKLIRNTLKNIEIQLKQYSNFIRCHRTYIVNVHYIEKLHHDFSSHWITIKGYPEKIPVSRQYLQKLREIL
jgi:DNA-binding LytR/AlgR family response regulator